MSGLRYARPLEVVHGIRGSVIALAAVAFAGVVLLAQTGPIVLGAVFPGEELYETGLLAAIIRAGERDEGRASGAPSRWNTLRALRVLKWWGSGSVTRGALPAMRD